MYCFLFFCCGGKLFTAMWVDECVCDVGCPSKGTNGASAFVCLFTALREGFLSDCVRRLQAEAPAACSLSAFASMWLSPRLASQWLVPPALLLPVLCWGQVCFSPFFQKLQQAEGCTQLILLLGRFCETGRVKAAPGDMCKDSSRCSYPMSWQEQT